MTSLSKAFWATEGNNIRFSMPIQKVDVEKRIVSGWATLDTIDKQGDIVSADASVEAFKRFRGNIREQHTSLAVGKMVSFKQDKYFDKASGQEHNGIYVDVYVSKGAQDTWHKVLENVLTGFSIGGRIKDSEDVYTKNADGPVRLIKSYELDELSLVDNPANPDANFVSIQKFSDMETTIEKNYLENVYWCSSNDTVILSTSNQHSCPQCNKVMTNIGFVESNDVNKADVIKGFLAQVSDEQSDIKEEAIDEVAKSIAENIEKEGISMARTKRVSEAPEDTEEIVEKSDVVEEAEVTEEVVEKLADEPAVETAEEVDSIEKSEEAAVEEVVEEAIEKSTTPADEGKDEDLAKSVDEIKVSLTDVLGEFSTTIKSLAMEIASLKKSLDSVTSEVEVVKGSVTEVKGSISEFGQRIEEVEADTAVRKSGDLGGIVQEERVNKSMWGGRFLSSADLYR